MPRWELDFWGKFRRGVESADANLLANIASYDDVLVTLTAEVARNYVLIRTLEERIRLARENITIQQRSLELTTNQYETGSVTELDMQQATTQLRNTQASVPNLLISLEQAQHALSILMGMPPQDLNEMLGSRPAASPPPRPRWPPAYRQTCCAGDRTSSRRNCRRPHSPPRSELPMPRCCPASPCSAPSAGTSHDAGNDDLGDLFDCQQPGVLDRPGVPVEDPELRPAEEPGACPGCPTASSC